MGLGLGLGLGLGSGLGSRLGFRGTDERDEEQRLDQVVLPLDKGVHDP